MQQHWRPPPPWRSGSLKGFTTPMKARAKRRRHFFCLYAHRQPGVYGGFAGDEMLRSHRDWEVHVTVLSGDLDQNDTTDADDVVTDTANITGTNAYHVVTSNGVTVTARLEGFSITAGKAIDGGGGMFNYKGSPTLDNLTFSGNDAGDTGARDVQPLKQQPHADQRDLLRQFDGWGWRRDDKLPKQPHAGQRDLWQFGQVEGGMFNYLSSSPMLTNVTFSGNEGGLGGGGMANTYGSNPMLTDVTFSGNDAGPRVVAGCETAPAATQC